MRPFEFKIPYTSLTSEYINLGILDTTVIRLRPKYHNKIYKIHKPINQQQQQYLHSGR
jgi:hypothetical protein